MRLPNIRGLFRKRARSRGVSLATSQTSSAVELAMGCFKCGWDTPRASDSGPMTCLYSPSTCPLLTGSGKLTVGRSGPAPLSPGARPIATPAMRTLKP